MLCLEKYIISSSTKAALKIGTVIYTVGGVKIVKTAGRQFINISNKSLKKFHTLILFLKNYVKEIGIYTKISV